MESVCDWLGIVTRFGVAAGSSSVAWGSSAGITDAGSGVGRWFVPEGRFHGVTIVLFAGAGRTDAGSDVVNRVVVAPAL